MWIFGLNKNFRFENLFFGVAFFWKFFLIIVKNFLSQYVSSQFVNLWSNPKWFFQRIFKKCQKQIFFWRKWDIFQNTKTSRFDRKGNPTNVPILQICKYSLAPRMIVKSNNSPPRKNCICEFLIVNFFFLAHHERWMNKWI